MVGEWKEKTDAGKHVFEDVGIACWLMLFWKDTFQKGSEEQAGRGGAFLPNTGNEEDIWANWPRPPGGFLDLGSVPSVLVSFPFT